MAKSKYKKRADGRYQANILVGYDEETKKEVYKTVYAYTEPDLENKKAEIKNAVNKGTYADDRKMKVKDLAEKWFLTDKATCGIRTKEMYERITYKHIIPAIGEIRLRDLKKSDIRKMLNERADKYRTCQQLKMAVIQMLDFGIEDGLLYKNVAYRIKLTKPDKVEKRPLTAVEKEGIKKANFTSKEKAFIYVLLYCGLKRGEILALSKSNVSLSTKKISVNNAVTFENGSPIVKAPKTNSSIRNIPITNELYAVLEPYMKNLKTYYLFTSEKGELMHKSTYDNFWKRIIEKINVAAGGTPTKQARKGQKEVKGLQVIHGLTAHVFRHNYATMLYYADVPIKDAQYLLGHNNIKITLDIYTHLDKDKNDIGDKIKEISAF
jgi:integrase